MKANVREREGSGGKAAGAASYVIAAALVLIAAFLTCSLLWTAVSLGAASQGGLAAPGHFLYSVYGVSSFLIPAFLLACAIALLLQDAPFPLYFLLLTSLIPFFTAFGGEKLIRAFAPAEGASMLSMLIFYGLLAAVLIAFAAELVLLFKVARGIERRAASKRKESQDERAKGREETSEKSGYIKEENRERKRENTAYIKEEKIEKERENPARIKEEKAAERPAAAFKPMEDVVSGASAKAAEPLVNIFDKINAKDVEDNTGEFLPLSSAKDEQLESAGSFERAGSAGNISASTSVLEEKAAAPAKVADEVEASGDEAVSFAFVDSAFEGEEAESSSALPQVPAAEGLAAQNVPESGEAFLAAQNVPESEESGLDAESAEALALYEEEAEAEGLALAADAGVEAAPAPAPAMPEPMTAEDVARLIPDVDFDPAMFEGYIAGNFSILDEEEVEALEDMGDGPRLEDFAGSKDVNHLEIGEESPALASVSSTRTQEAVAPDAPAAKPAGSLLTKASRLKYHIDCDILNAYPDGEYWVIDEDTNKAAAILKDTLKEFRIQADVTGIRKGPVITMFEILPAPGVKLSKIVGLQDNIALRLAASSVRIVAPIPGKHAVGIEVPNKKRAIVSFRELIETDTPDSKKMSIPVMLGKDITGEAQIIDLAATPHLLIAGSTGSGKSVCVNSIILSILYKRAPSEVKLILIDPKVVELKLYNDIGHLLAPVITEPKKAFQALQYCICEMERRYAVLDGMGVRNIKEYNKRIEERGIAAEPLPYIVVIIDEFADLMATTGKELESTVARLAAMSRAVGIHLVLATQRPSIDVITGLIKANIPSRIAFMVASKTDSRIIIDQVGAEKLLGKGDMLYSSVTDPFPVRIQGAFVSDEEVERVVEQVKAFGAPEYIDDEIFVDDDDDDSLDNSFFGEGEDPLYDKALDIVLSAGKASASYIQRRLKIGYNRAARLVEDMEARGIVGPANGSKAREVIHVPERAS